MVGVITGILVAGIQALLFFKSDFFKNNTLINYAQVNFVLVGVLMGLGALLGDLIESFIKRRLNKPSGRPWFPWDQIDWIMGAMVLSWAIYRPSAKVVVVTLVLFTIVHLCSDRVVYRMGIKKREEVN